MKARPASLKLPFGNARTAGGKDRSRKAARRFRVSPAMAPERFEVTADVGREVNGIDGAVRIAGRSSDNTRRGRVPCY